MGNIKLILTAVFSIIGVVSVVMIVLGGISYATSQGDPGKVKKGKDTILYGHYRPYRCPSCICNCQLRSWCSSGLS